MKYHSVLSARSCFLLLSVIAIIPLINGQVDSNVPQCKGVFDFYFVLDSSGSVGGNFKTEIVPFVNNVSTNFINPNFRISFVTFATQGMVLLNLTSDRKEIAQGLDNLQAHSVGGSTNLATGLAKVNKQIDALGGDTASVVLILTDGVISDQSNTVIQASMLRDKGASIFAIGIANANQNQLNQLVNDEKEVFIGGDFQYLTTIINQVINDTCIEITAADPVQVCANQDISGLTLTGQGFTNTINSNTTACRFLFNETDFQISKPVGQIEYDTLICSVPNFKVPQEVLLQVTLNGLTYISSNVTLSVIDCTTPTPQSVNAGLAAGLTLSLIGLIVIIILILLWFFLPLITGKIIFQPKPPKKEEANDDDTDRPKWATVDASYYGGRGAGGIAPMKVHWGEKGATAEGNKLAAAKDANIIEMGQDAPNSVSNRNHHAAGPSCMTKTLATIKRWLISVYFTLSSLRPVRNHDGSIMWCPYFNKGRHHGKASSEVCVTGASGGGGGLSNPVYEHISKFSSSKETATESDSNLPPPVIRSSSVSTAQAPPARLAAPPARPSNKSNTLQPPPRPPPRSNTLPSRHTPPKNN